MEYSLNHLNSISNLRELTLPHLINSLNLIGLEIDGISKKKMKPSSSLSLEKIKILIKIPANREDLLIEDFFLEEISTLFLVTILNLWKTVKKNYNFLLKQKYGEYSQYSTVVIETKLPSIITYAIELKNFQNISSPLWVRNKLENLSIDTSNDFNDVLNLVISEWGQLLNFSKISSDNVSKYSLKRLEETAYFVDSEGKSIQLAPGSIVLKNNSNQILTVLGILNITPKDSYHEKVILETTFYNIEDNKLLIHIFNPKLSLRYFRKMFLEKLKFSFQRLLTLIEILDYSSNLLPIKYCARDPKIFLVPNKILILKKKSLRDILGLEKFDETIFQQAGLKVICKTVNALYFNIPNSRKDLTREIDLIEEYSRFLGYKNFQEILPMKHFSPSSKKN